MHLCRSQEKFENEQTAIRALEQYFGNSLDEHTILTKEQCIEIEPSLAHSTAPLAGGILWSGNESGDCCMFTQQLADKCAEQYDVQFLYDKRIDQLVRDEADPGRISTVITSEGDHIKADLFILCMGSYTSQMLDSLGVKLPIYPVKGYSLTIPIQQSSETKGTDATAVPTMNMADLETKTYIAR